MHPVVNCEEFIGKTVGRRTLPPQPLRTGDGQRSAAESWRNHGFVPRLRKGVYRFHSHEEADQWLMDHMIRKPGN